MVKYHQENPEVFGGINSLKHIDVSHIHFFHFLIDLIDVVVNPFLFHDDSKEMYLLLNVLVNRKSD
jgi:hypothetical protein